MYRCIAANRRFGPVDLRAAKNLRLAEVVDGTNLMWSNTNRRRDGRRSELVQDIDQLSVR